ncbi:hypothetical protein BJX65DRAFT_310393 [Aspergillus insuetus]
MSESETRFMEKWAGTVITLTNPTSSWTLEEKLGEYNSQRDAERVHEYHKPSGAWASFLCRSTGNADDVTLEMHDEDTEMELSSCCLRYGKWCVRTTLPRPFPF